MISRNAITSAMETVSSLESRGHAVVTRNGHFDVLSTLLTPTRVKGSNISLEQAVEDTQLAPTALTLDYREQLNDLRAIWQRPMIARIRMIREKVVPFLDDLSQSCMNEYTTLNVVDPEVRPIKVTDIYKHTNFLEFISRHRPTNSQEIDTVEFLGGQMVRSEEDIVKLMQTGSIVLDDALMDMVASHPEGWLKSIYEELFVNGCTFPAKLYNPWMQIEQVDKIIVAYILVSSLIARDIVDATIQMSLADYRAYISKLLSQCGILINRYCHLLSLDLKTGKVVAFFDQAAQVIHVHEALYTQYITDGGSPEALIGAVRSRAPVSLNELVATVNADMSEYVKQNERILSDQKANFKMNFLQSFKVAFPKLIQQQPSDLQHLFSKEPADYDEGGRLSDTTAHRLATIAANAMNDYASLDISKLIFKGIIDTLLAKYEFSAFLNNVNAYMEKGYVANEAVFHAAMIEIVDKLVSRNLRVVKLEDI